MNCCVSAKASLTSITTVFPDWFIRAKNRHPRKQIECSWSVQLECAVGVSSWSVKLECEVGVCSWSVKLECEVGVCSWIVLAPHRLDHDVQGLRGVVAHRLHVEPFEDVQADQGRQPLPIRRDLVHIHTCPV